MILAMGQMKVEMGQAVRNLERAAGVIAQAGRAGAQIAVLPECLDLGWTYPEAPRVAQPIPGPHSGVLAAAARAAGVYVAAGLTEKDGDRTYNAAVLLSPEGEILLKHRKINELDIALDIYSTGDRLGVAHTPLGNIGVNICADNFPQSLYLAQSLIRMGAELILSPCAWAVDADRDHARDPYGGLWRGSYGTLTWQHPVTIVGVSCVGWLTAGPWKGRKTIGCSLAMGPGARLLAEGPFGEEAEALIPVAIPAVGGHTR